MTKTSWVEISVSNFEESLAWFENVLGFRVTARTANDHAELSCGEVFLYVAADHTADRASHPRLPPAGQRGSGVEIVLLVDDVDAIYRQAQQAAADIVRPLAEYPWHMRQFWVRHPDGYLLRPAQKILSINPTLYQRQIAEAFQRTLPLVVQGLYPVKEAAETLVQQQDYLGAATLYETLITEIIEESHLYYEEDEEDEYYEEEEYYPEEEGLEELVVACIEALGAILAHEQADQAVREKCIDVLFDIYQRDLHADNRHGFDVHAADQLIATTAPLERRTLAERIRTRVGGKIVITSVQRQAYGKLWLALEKEVLDDEAYLRICRQTGCTSNLIDHLLTLGRLKEAEEETEQADNAVLLQLIDLFIQHGQEAVAERLVKARTREQPARPLLAWLQTYYRERQHSDAELEVTETLFHVQPSLPAYQQVRTLAEQLNRWEALRVELLDFLVQASKAALLIQIALDEGDIDRALQLLKGVEKKDRPGYSYVYISGYGYSGFNALTLQVAQAAEELRPQEAIELYRDLVEKLIAQRGRQNYQEACKHLTKIRALYEKSGESAAWSRYITTLREQNRNLRALKEELAHAGLSGSV